LGDGSEDHLEADDQIKYDVARVPRKQIKRGQNLEQARLPEGEKQDRLHRQELVEWVKRRESLLCGEVEEHKEVEG